MVEVTNEVLGDAARRARAHETRREPAAGDDADRACQGRQRYSRRAIAAVVLVVIVAVAPRCLGYLMAPPGLHYTGAPVFTEDSAQHEAWAAQMAVHLRYLNVLTPEPTARGWFVSPWDLVIGIVQRITGIPYAVIGSVLTVLSAPLLAVGLMTVAGRANIPRPGAAAVVAMLAGSFAPVLYGAVQVGLLQHADMATIRLAGMDATPIFAAKGPDLALAVLVLAALPLTRRSDPARGFLVAGVMLFFLALLYPFFIPTLVLTAALCASLWMRRWGWRPMLEGLLRLGLLATPPMLYWALLPSLDPEYARFAAANRQGVFMPHVVLLSLGIGAGAIFGIPRLVRGNRHQQMLACVTIAVLTALYIPAHPWRQHIFNLSPVVVIASLAAWWPVLERLRRGVRASVTAALLALATLSVPYYYVHNLRGLVHHGPPTYLTTGYVAAIRWLAHHADAGVVLARSDVSPWIAAHSHQKVVVGHWLWTRDYHRRLAEVRDVFEQGADPRGLIRRDRVTWVVVDEERGTPPWARGLEPAARFDRTVVLPADRILGQREHRRTRID